MSKKSISKEMKEHLQKCPSIKYDEKYEFYVEDVIYNLYNQTWTKEEHKQMFEDGYGSELKDSSKSPAKAKSLISSSMLAYNFFSWIDEEHIFTYDEVDYDKVFFEVKLKTLKNRASYANLDVLLVSSKSNKVWFIESKFTEFYSKAKCELAEAYTKADDKPLRDLAELYIKINKDEGYLEGIKQNICHIFGMTNFANGGNALPKGCTDLENIMKAKPQIKFTNLLFNANDDEEYYDNYANKLSKFKEKLGKDIKANINLNNFVITYREIFEELPIDLDRRNYLENRYMSLHK